MRSFVLGAIGLTLLADYGVNAVGFPKAKRGNGFLQIPVGTVEKPKMVKRDGDSGQSHAIDLFNNEFYYSTEIEFGNPGQKVMVLVNTGSSELWVNPDCTTAASDEDEQTCKKWGQYDPDKSDPVGPFGSEEIHFGDPSDPKTRTSVELVYYADQIALGDAVIKNQTFGVVTASKGQSQGIFGLAPDMEHGFDGDKPYSLVLNSMKTEGIISSRVFSLDLRHAEAATGAIIYGGVDKSKFIGKLESLPTIRGSSNEYRLGVAIDSIGITIDGESSNSTLKGNDTDVMLDSGTTLTRLHKSVASPLLKAMKALDDNNGYHYVDCDLRTSAGSVDFGFGSKTLRVPFRDFILDFDSGTGLCIVGLVQTTDTQILGDSVLRAGYFVFDWDDEAVHVAQAANCDDQEDIVAVGEGQTDINKVEGNCKESDAAFTGGTITSASATATPTGGSSSTHTNDSQGGSQDGDDEDNGGASLKIPMITWTVMALVGAGVMVNLL